MTNVRKRVTGLLVLGFMFILFGGSKSSCDVTIRDGSSDSSCNSCNNDSSYSNRSDTSDTSDTKDELLVSGSGEHINLEYNKFVFAAILNYDSGLYYFAPDPKGEITGDKIICSTSIDDSNVEGDCFRQGHVCHFDYWYDSWSSDTNKDAYYLGTSSCREGGEVGPFLVPLDSPVCGEDPFPACPTDDLFPDGPASDPEPETPSQESQPTSPESQPTT